MPVAVEVVDAYIQALPGERRRIAHTEWGFTLAAEQAGGWPLDVGVRLADGLLTVKAHALTDAELIDPWMLLWWNRSTRLVRFSATQGQEIWVHGDLPVAAVDEVGLDRLLGLVVEGAVAVRDFQRAKRNPAPAENGWLDPSE
jgi:hypothetical protein